MIKVGDIRVCVEDIYHFSTKNIRFIKGNHYIVKRCDNNFEFWLTPEDGDGDCYVSIDSKRFITLAQWREKQINDILNDDIL